MPAADPAPLAATGSPRPIAPLTRRYLALGYEGLLLAAIALLVGFLTLPLVAATPGARHALAVPPLAGRALSACLLFGVAGLYFVRSWTAGRRTLPMKTWRMALVRADGGVVDGKAAVVRYVTAWLGPAAALTAHAALSPAGLGAHALWLVALGFLWPFVDRDRQFLHDRIAGTRIVTT